MRRLAEEIDADVLDGGLNSIEAGGLALGVYLMNQVVDLALMRLQPRVDIGLVDVNGALFAGHDEVEVQCKTHPGVEWHPGLRTGIRRTMETTKNRGASKRER